jgi:hypothetical protein
MSIIPIAISGPIIIKLNKKYGLTKLRSKIAAIDTTDDTMKICLPLILLHLAGFAPFTSALNLV